jgi:hypothetical protein
MEFNNLTTIKEKGYQIKKGIRKNMKTRESKTCLLFAYRLATTTMDCTSYHHATATVLQQLSSCNNYHDAHIVICKLERRPPTTYKLPIVVVYHCNIYRLFLVVAYHLQCL